MFPLAPNAKAPAVRDWERRASTDPANVDQWPRATTGYGVACGPSGLYVVDCDQPKPDTPPAPESAADATCGYDVLLLLAAEAGEPAPGNTFTVQTGRGGLHLYYQMPDDLLGNSAGRLGWLIDTRGRGGYVVGPGSTVAGSAYRTTQATRPAPLPEWITRALTQATQSTAAPARTGKPASQSGGSGLPATSAALVSGSPVRPEWGQAALDSEAERIRSAASGQGNAVVNSAAWRVGQLVGANMLARDVAENVLTAALDTWTWAQPGDRARMLRTMASAMTAGERSPRVITPKQPLQRAAYVTQ